MVLVVRGLLDVPIAGSLGLFLFGVVLYLFSATALGLYLGTIAGSMAQFALLIILVVIVLQLLSGGNTPVESQPPWMQRLTLLLPSRHFVSFSQAIIFRGPGSRPSGRNSYPFPPSVLPSSPSASDSSASRSP